MSNVSYNVKFNCLFWCFVLRLFRDNSVLPLTVKLQIGPTETKAQLDGANDFVDR